MAAEPERWHLTADGAEHEVEIVDKGIRREATWRVDGVEVATKGTSEKRLVLEGGEHGAVGLRLPEFVGPARRVTFYSPAAEGVGGAKTAAYAGMGGVDFDPEPGSAAAKREEWIRAHPNLHSAKRTLAAVAGIAVPLLVAWLVSLIALPSISIPWPDWDIPWPRIPWPDWNIPWPTIPWPDLPDLPPVPPWVGTLLDALKFILPVVIAFVLARAELRRRRRQDEHKRAAARPVEANSEPPPPESKPEPEATQGPPVEQEQSQERRESQPPATPPRGE